MAATNTPNVGRRQTGRARRGQRGGFTLVELLVVIAVILVLISILLPTIAKAYRNGVRTRMVADMGAIVTALEAYRTDHGDIPRISADPANWKHLGDALLCRTLLAPLPAVDANASEPDLHDGQDGNGFRVRPSIVVGSVVTPQGKPYGPYLAADKFKTKFDVGTKSLYIADLSGNRILYLPGRKGANLNAVGGYVGDVSYTDVLAVRPMFNLRDLHDTPTNDDRIKLFDNDTPGTGPDKFRVLLGANTNGSGLDPQLTGEYLLWGAGPDEKFGFEGAVSTAADQAARQRARSDDVSYPSR
jgi:prepilin-type N-terminal cleavage/methylation domain-containing protein